MSYRQKTACPACGELIQPKLLASHLENPSCHLRARNLGAHRSVIELGLVPAASELPACVTFRFDDPEGGVVGTFTYSWVPGLREHLAGLWAGQDGLARAIHAMRRHRLWARLQAAPPGAARDAGAFEVFFGSLDEPARQRFYLARASRLAGAIQELQLRRLVLTKGGSPDEE